jgi:hypothetical protein
MNSCEIAMKVRRCVEWCLRTSPPYVMHMPNVCAALLTTSSYVGISGMPTRVLVRFS